MDDPRESQPGAIDTPLKREAKYDETNQDLAKNATDKQVIDADKRQRASSARASSAQTFFSGGWRRSRCGAIGGDDSSDRSLARSAREVIDRRLLDGF